MKPLTVQEIRSLYEKDKIVKFYKHRYWSKHIRLQALERDNNECQACKRLGEYRKGRNVHHIKELRDRPDLANNLETPQCHNAE
ncbi:HNH endonuclease, partial [Bacillus cereus]